jgi:hypothetical protein
MDTTQSGAAQKPASNGTGLSSRPQNQQQNRNRNRRNDFRSRRNGHQPQRTPSGAVATQNPTFMVKKEYDATAHPLSSALKNIQAIKNIKGTTLKKGNLAASHLNKTLMHGPKIATNSPEIFPDGKPVRIIPIGGVNDRPRVR